MWRSSSPPISRMRSLGEQGKRPRLNCTATPRSPSARLLWAAIVSQIVDGMAAANIGIGVTMSQLAEAGVPLTPEMVQEVVDAYDTGRGSAQQAGQSDPNASAAGPGSGQ